MASGSIKLNTTNTTSLVFGGSSGGNSAQETEITDNKLYITSTLVPTREGMNTYMLTWNTHLSDGEYTVVKVWRVLTSLTVDKLKISDGWSDVEASPDVIFTNLNGASIKNITSQAKEGALYREGIDADEYSGDNVIAILTYQHADGVRVRAHGVYSIQNYCISSAPSLAYNAEDGKLTIGESMVGRRLIEFHRTDKPYGYPTNISDEDTLNQMLLTTVISQERWSTPYAGYYYIDSESLTRWAKGNYTIGVKFLDSKNKTRISDGINSAISQINDLLDEFEIHFTRETGTSGNITITVDTHLNLYGYDIAPGTYVYAGSWDTTTNSQGIITSADVKIATDTLDIAPFMTLETAILEELVQSLGAGQDQYEYPLNTLHTELNYYNKSSTLSTKDKNILRLIYSPYVDAGDHYDVLSKNLNIPKGVYRHWPPTETNEELIIPLTSSTHDIFEAGASYQVRAFIVNSSGKMSYTSDWLDIVIPGTSSRPSNWSWTTSNGDASDTETRNAGYAVNKRSGYYVKDFSYFVWNDLVKKVGEFLKYKKMDDTAINETKYGFPSTTTYSQMLPYAEMNNTESDGKVLTAKRFNIVKYCIGSMESTGIPDQSKGNIVYGHYFTTLTDKLNSIT